MHSGGNTSSLIGRCRHACIVTLMKVFSLSSALGIKIMKSMYSWTHCHRRTCEEHLLKTLPRSFVLFSFFGQCHSVCGDTVFREKVMASGSFFMFWPIDMDA